MSLKAMIESNKEFQSIIRKNLPGKEEFKTVSGKNAFSEYEIKTPYLLNNSTEASLVGTSFDYLARAMIAQVLDNDKEQAVLDIKALQGLKILKSHIDGNSYNHIRQRYVEVLADFWEYIYSNLAPSPNNLFDKCSQEEWNALTRFTERRLYKSHKTIDNIAELISGAWFLSQLENIYRSRKISEDAVEKLLLSPTGKIEKDILDLCNIFKTYFIDIGLVEPDSIVVFNPEFGLGTLLCKGADADIYIDGTLYDFKTTKKLGYEWKSIAQIVSYYYLNKLARYKECKIPAPLKDYEILNIAFYKARYGEIEYCNTNFFDTKKALDNFDEVAQYLIAHHNAF